MYYRILGYVDSIDDSSYPRNVKQPDGSKVEVMYEQWTFNLRVPGQKDFTKVTIAADVQGFPGKDQRDRWEDSDTTLVVIEADRLTTVAGGGGADGPAWGFSSFHGLSVQEASPADQKLIKDRRRQIKAEQKAARDKAHAEKLAAKKKTAA